MRRLGVLVVIFFGSFLAGCSQLLGVDDVVLVTHDAGPLDASVDGAIVDPPDAGETITACSRVDLLFVIDDSGSMAEEQGNLTINLPGFMQILQSYRTQLGAPLDYRIGVITPGRDLMYQLALPGVPGFPVTEEGENGVLRDGCGLERRWIEAEDSDPAGLFGCRAAVGTDGSATEMPLYALKLATFDRVIDGTNAGFLRADAPLVMMVISDEDDCSREDSGFMTSEICASEELTATTRYRDYFDQLKGSRDLWAMAIVAAPGPGDCTSKFGMASDAVRLRELRDQTGDNVVFESICDGNLAISMARLLAVVEQTCAE